MTRKGRKECYVSAVLYRPGHVRSGAEDKIAQKYQEGIGYDYDAAMEKCRKKAAKKSRADDPGGDAMTMALLKKQREAEAKAEKAAAKAGASSSASEDNGDSPWAEDE